MTAFSQVLAAQFGPYALPDGTEPLFVADFKNGVYLVDGNPGTLADIFVEDLNWGHFNPVADIVAGVGMTKTGANGPSPVVATDNLATLLNNSTVILQWTWTGEIGGNIIVNHADIVGFSIEHQVNVRSTGVENVGSIELTDFTVPDETQAFAQGAGKLAATFTPSRMALSTNGAAAVGITPDANEGINQIGILMNNAHFVLEQVAFYPPQLDADLPTLSAL